ncbi:MAG: ATP-dependent RecD-like DNA helicase [Myxococcota bacterium]
MWTPEGPALRKWRSSSSATSDWEESIRTSLRDGPRGALEAALALTAAIDRSGHDGTFLLCWVHFVDLFHGSTHSVLDANHFAQRIRLLDGMSGPSHVQAALAAAEDPTLVDDVSGAPFARVDDSLVARRFLNAERRIQSDLSRLEGAAKALSVEAFEAASRRVPLLGEDQHGALSAARTQAVTLVVGGPGTGKTVLSGRIVRAWVEAGLSPRRVVRAAPTGKAAQRMAQATVDLPELSLPGTLHRLLQTGTDVWEAVLVDEASMVGTELMARLLGSIPTGARLVLMGDPDQLPSVDAGAPLRDLCRGFSHWTRTLTQPRRTREGGVLLKAARAVRAGDADALRTLSSVVRHPDGHGDGLFWLPSDPRDVQGERTVLIRWFQQARRRNAVLLAVTKDGPRGTRAFNRLAMSLRGSTPDRMAPGQPLIATRNDYSRGLFNGELGRVTEDGAVEFEGGRRFRLGSLTGLEPADALTVHKAQGSEVDDLLFALPPPHHGLGTREMLYTALTRARRRVILLGTDEALAGMLEARSVRTTGRLGGRTP